MVMSRRDSRKFEVIGHTESAKAAAIASEEENQFMEYNFIQKLFIQNKELKSSKILS